MAKGSRFKSLPRRTIRFNSVKYGELTGSGILHKSHVFAEKISRKERRRKRKIKGETPRARHCCFPFFGANCREQKKRMNREKDRGEALTRQEQERETRSRRALKNATVANLVESFQSIDFIGSLSRPRVYLKLQARLIERNLIREFFSREGRNERKEEEEEEEEKKRKEDARKREFAKKISSADT